MPLDYVGVARAVDIPPGTVQMVRTGERWVALANVNGTLYAADNRCPHNGGPLGQGILRGSELECPWHGWRWDVVTGRATRPESPWRLQRLPVRVNAGMVEVLDV